MAPSRVGILSLAGLCPVMALALRLSAWRFGSPEFRSPQEARLASHGGEVLGIHGPLAWNATSWLVLYYAILNFALLVLPLDSWRRLESMAASMEDVITGRQDREHLVRVVLRARRLDIQAVVGFVSFGAGLIGAAFAARALGVPVLAAVPFELSVGITMVLGSNVVLWIACGLYWLRQMAQLESIRFDTVDALLSPGLGHMYRLATRAQWYATLGVVLALIPLVFLYYQVRSSVFLQTVVVVGGAGSVLVVLLAYALAPWYLHAMRRDDKRALLQAVRATLPEDIASLSHNELVLHGPALDLYARIERRPTGGLEGGLVAGLVVALATLGAAFLPLILQTH